MKLSRTTRAHQTADRLRNMCRSGQLDLEVNPDDVSVVGSDHWIYANCREMDDVKKLRPVRPGVAFAEPTAWLGVWLVVRWQSTLASIDAVNCLVVTVRRMYVDRRDFERSNGTKARKAWGAPSMDWVPAGA
jgi:hypothetical protein